MIEVKRVIVKMIGNEADVDEYGCLVGRFCIEGLRRQVGLVF